MSKKDDSWAKMPWFKALKELAKKEAEIKQMTSEEFWALSRKLEDKHSVFYKFWEVGKPYFTYMAATAAVAFDAKTGQYVSFVFNPEFWKWLGEKKDEKTGKVKTDSYSRLFVIGHEMLHLILRHGLRTKDCDNHIMANICLDVVVNHLLVDKFGFDRKKVKGSEEVCWLDTVFTKENGYTGPVPEKNKAFEYYYLLAKKYFPKSGGGKGEKGEGQGQGQKGDGQGEGMPQLVDNHDGLSPEDVDELLKEMNETLSDEEKKELQGMIEEHCQADDGGPDHKGEKGNGADGAKGGKEAGKSGQGIWTFANVGKVKTKKKWETVIKKWASMKMSVQMRDTEQWARVNRRFVAVEQQTGGLMIPTEMETEDRFEDEDMIEVILFQDTSGSCAHLVDRFFKAGLSLPPERFKVTYCGFDTSVYEVDVKNRKLRVGGGTSFSILEAYVQKKIKDGTFKKYPTCFCITDGAGDTINPEKPELWYFFLSENYRSCIPEKCNILMLRDYE